MSAPTVRRRRLGAKLREYRDSRGLTLEGVADKTEGAINAVKLSRLETARTAIQPADIELLLDVYEVNDQELRAALLTLTKQGARRGWWHSYRGILTPMYEDLIGLEAEVSSIRLFQLGIVPGLLQTAAYARHVIAATGMTAASEDRVGQLVEIRIARQGVLTSRAELGPPEVWAIIHENALRAQIADPSIMREQLQRLCHVAELPHVSIQVLPAAVPPHPGVFGAFNILSFPEHAALDVVYEESLTSVRYIEETDEVRTYGAAFERLRAAALPFDDSVEFISKLKEQV